jgi:hypothetical protein
VTFSEPVANVDSNDFSLNVAGGIMGAAISKAIGSGATYTVTVTTGTGSGTLGLNVPVTASITDLASNSLGSLPFTSGENYIIDKTAPSIISIVVADPNPTSAANARFTVTFSEPVAGVDSNDFALHIIGNINGAIVSNVNGFGNVYTVTVNTGTGNGKFRLDVPVTAAITDLAGNPLKGLPFTSGETYRKTKPHR